MIMLYVPFCHLIKENIISQGPFERKVEEKNLLEALSEGIKVSKSFMVYRALIKISRTIT